MINGQNAPALIMHTETDTGTPSVTRSRPFTPAPVHACPRPCPAPALPLGNLNPVPEVEGWGVILGGWFDHFRPDQPTPRPPP
jgi:hypothetical protein